MNDSIQMPVLFCGVLNYIFTFSCFSFYVFFLTLLIGDSATGFDKIPAQYLIVLVIIEHKEKNINKKMSTRNVGKLRHPKMIL